MSALFSLSICLLVHSDKYAQEFLFLTMTNVLRI